MNSKKGFNKAEDLSSGSIIKLTRLIYITIAMTDKSTTFQTAMTVLGIDMSTDAAPNTYKTAGVSPQELLRHSTTKEYNILGIISDEFIRLHGATIIDFDKLKNDFKKICKDYFMQLDKNSKAVEFCSKILYDARPQARQVRKNDGDKTWKFMFFHKENNKFIVKVAFVSTYKTEETNYVPAANYDRIALSVKNGSLLALLTSEQLYLLTPLALGTIFLSW